ncbi:MAG: hypothetical protein ABIQ32_00380 [Sphingomicrobium sp.]
MRIQPLLAGIILTVLGTPAAAQTRTVEDYLHRIGSVNPKTLTVADCTSKVTDANALNAADLFYASAVCKVLNKQVESNFLLIAGQVRGSADMAVMAPVAKADLEAAGALYGFIFYYAGGPGDIEVLRAASTRKQFFRLFDAWSPRYDSAYSPGWNVGVRPDDATYRQALSEVRSGRRSQLNDMSVLYADQQYYALQRQFDDLQKKTSGRYEEGTAPAKLASDLQKRMDERARLLGVGAQRPDTDSGSQKATPPSAPAKNETVVSSSSDPTVKQCEDWANNLARMSLQKIVRVVMTKGSEWGLVWRADLATSDTPPEVSRFICSKHGTMLESGDAPERKPLP